MLKANRVFSCMKLIGFLVPEANQLFLPTGDFVPEANNTLTVVLIYRIS